MEVQSISSETDFGMVPKEEHRLSDGRTTSLNANFVKEGTKDNQINRAYHHD